MDGGLVLTIALLAFASWRLWRHYRPRSPGIEPILPATRARKRRGPCPRCHYIGNRHLCGCMGELGQAIRAGDPVQVQRVYEGIVKRANEEERDPSNWRPA